MTFQKFNKGILFGLILSFSFVLFSCERNAKNKSLVIEESRESSIKYAIGFDIQYFKNHKKLILKTPYLKAKESFEFILSNEKTNNESLHPITFSGG